MSTFLEEKLATPERVQNERAQARAEQLWDRRGCEQFNPRTTERVHVLQQITGRVEIWRRVGGPGGKDTVYELVEEREVLP